MAGFCDSTSNKNFKIKPANQNNHYKKQNNEK